MSSFSEIINKEQPVLIDFFATWCGPCQTQSPILSQLKEDFGDKLTVIKIDIDKNPALASQLHVRSVPTLLLYKNGKQVWRQAGLVSKSDLSRIVKEFENK